MMISEANGADRERLVDSFFIVHDDLINFVARRQCRAYGLSYADRFDDVRAIARETAWLILNNLDTEGAEAIRSFPAYLMTRTRTAVRVASESAAWTGVSGSVGRMRRHRALETRLGPVRRELGRDLTKQETRAAIAAYNDELRATRTDAEKQGALVSEADLAPPTLVDLCENNAATFTVDEAEIAPFEMVNVAKAVVANAYHGRHDLGVIAQAYYGPYLADRQSEPPRIPEIVANTGFNRMKVSRAILRIHELSRAELVELGFPRHAPFQPQD